MTTPSLVAAVTAQAARPGAFAFGLIVALFVVTVLLWLSMRRHLGRIDVDRDRRDEATAEGTPHGTAPEPRDPSSPDPPAPERPDGRNA
jgi:hypothetical protein